MSEAFSYMLLHFQYESDLFCQDSFSLILSKCFNQPVDWDMNGSELPLTISVIMASVHKEEASHKPSAFDIRPFNKNQDQIVMSHYNASTGNQNALRLLPATPVVVLLFCEEEAFHVQPLLDTRPSNENQDQII